MYRHNALHFNVASAKHMIYNISIPSYVMRALYTNTDLAIVPAHVERIRLSCTKIQINIRTAQCASTVGCENIHKSSGIKSRL